MKIKQQYIAIYSRKSKFTQKGESIWNQAELCRNYIESHYKDNIYDGIEVYEDEGFSGGNLNRPGFRKMMEDARNNRLKAIIVYRLDRISRSISDFSSLIQELSRLDIAFISIKEQFDTTTPMGRAMMYIASVFSQLERETIAERIRDNMLQLAKTGRWLGGTTPMGFSSQALKTVTVDGKEKKACMLKLVPHEAEKVKLIYRLYMEYNSQSLTESHLMSLGMKTRKGKYFSRFSIKSILQNPVYAAADFHTFNYFKNAGACISSNEKDFDGVHGLMAYNRTYQEKGKTTVYRPESQWIVSVGKHTALIPGNHWVSVQRSLDSNKTKSYHKPRSNQALLTGIIYCSCGSRMYPKLGRSQSDDGKRSFSYVCKTKERSRGSLCRVKNINGNVLDVSVTEEIKNLFEIKEIFRDTLKKYGSFYTEDNCICNEHLAMLQQEKKDIKYKIQGLVDSLSTLDDSDAKVHITERINGLHKEYEALQSRIDETERLSSLYTLNHRQLHRICEFLSTFRGTMEKMDIEQKRSAIRSLVKKVVWNGETAHVFFSEDEVQPQEHEG